MNIFYKKSIVLSMLMVNFLVFSQETLTKKIEKKYEISKTGELYLNNKYGNININGWDKSNVVITIDIKVTSKKKDNAKALLDRIEPKFRATTNYVSVISEITEKHTSFLSRYFNLLNPFELDKTNMEINYTLYLPKSMDIVVENKFGDVIIEHWAGKLKANVEHGDLWISEPIMNIYADMLFGKLRAKSIAHGAINLKNGNIEIDESQDLILKTSGTNIKIDKVENLKIESSKDEVVIDYLENIEGDVNFSNMQINEMDNNIDLKMKVTDFRVLKMNQPDATVNINQESSDISINVSGLSFKFNATLEEGLLRLPKTFKKIKSKMVIDKGTRIRNIKATYGVQPKSTFSFTGKKGIITLKE
ncbi:DUF4097 family beta strand repeat-containing protein [Aestuariivivens insulae]|uniref:hypothetical protein n=1 Tax=Aestuariivivens insulae TaxID=1621988 RepID=UPI001F58EF89|nr:hypothetical protein [Aestuariivivens insulae]